MEISTSDIPFAFKILTTKKLSSYAFFRVPFMTALFYEVILEVFFFFFDNPPKIRTIFTFPFAIRKAFFRWKLWGSRTKAHDRGPGTPFH